MISTKIIKLKKKLLHYTGKAISDYKLIEKKDKILVCLSGGKDSLTLTYLLRQLQIKTNNKFSIHSLTISPNKHLSENVSIQTWLEKNSIPFDFIYEDILAIVNKQNPTTKIQCSFCSRLRRGIIYTYAKKHGFNKIALGHHRDDVIETFLMSILYSGQTQAMPPKLLTNDQKHIVIRPLTYCQENDIKEFAHLMDFPITKFFSCGSAPISKRKEIKELICQLASNNRKIPSNILHAISSIRPSQMLDKNLWNFIDLKIKENN